MKAAKATFLDAYRANTCCVYKACDAAGVSRPTYYVWKNEDAKFRQAIDDIDQEFLDKVEAVAYKKALIEESDEWVNAVLKVKAIARGWSKAQEQAVSGNLKVEVIRRVINDAQAPDTAGDAPVGTSC
jgi:hypothetical protein